MIKHIFILTFLFCFPLGPLSALENSSQNLVLQTHRPYLLTTPPQAKLHLDSNSYLRVKDLGQQVQLTGVKSGRTKLRVNKQVFNILVLSPSLYNSYQMAQPILEKTFGLSLVYNRGHLEVQGTLYSMTDFEFLQEQLKDLPKPLKWRAQLDPPIKNIFKARFAKTLNSMNIFSWQMENSPHLVLNLSSQFKDQLGSLNKSTYPLSLDFKFSKNILPSKPLIETQVLIAEVNKKWIEKYGFQWQKTFSQKLLPEAMGDDLIVQLAMSQNKNSGRILASPKIVTQSGQKGEFLAGGQFAIRSHSQYSSSVQWKSHGLSLNVTPKAGVNGRIQINFESEFSVIDHSQAIGDIPALKTNRTKNTLNLNSGESLVISGLIKENVGSGEDGLIGLQEIPILGELFKSHSYQKDITELIVILTPRIINPPKDPNYGSSS